MLRKGFSATFFRRKGALLVINKQFIAKEFKANVVEVTGDKSGAPKRKPARFKEGSFGGKGDHFAGRGGRGEGSSGGAKIVSEKKNNPFPTPSPFNSQGGM